MNRISLKETMNEIYKLEMQNKKCTMLGIGPMSENLIDAAFLLAKKDG
jgi:hypothetical protein